MTPTSSDPNWYMDTRVTSHMSNTIGNMLSISHKGSFHSIVVGIIGMCNPFTDLGQATINPQKNLLHLTNVLMAHRIIKNLIFVNKFIIDSKVSINFDPFGFSVNDLTTSALRL